jgi:hypothetical protein
MIGLSLLFIAFIYLSEVRCSLSSLDLLLLQNLKSQVQEIKHSSLDEEIINAAKKDIHSMSPLITNSMSSRSLSTSDDSVYFIVEQSTER